MRLRPYAEEDRDLTAQLERDAEVMRHLGGAAPAGRAERVHERRLERRGEEWYRTILAGPDDTPVGVVAVFRTMWEGRDIHELGIMLLPGRALRHGLGAAAVRLVVDEVRAARTVREIHAFIGADNRAAAMVARRTGFRDTGPCALDYEGEPILCNHWVLTLETGEPAAGV
ncbi:GNAT family N-acetyltransferase [Dactylosporangium vinaceum]|uniref:GNAT family N-acetyltransferase n=1 Tax=Dactylosporangium vinaceum TaxID=53362 RepID=A0ABV5MFU0_9ACTN|nr:GNAT family N-acetyltransferase [Dactylosporangium vinaceum]UAB98834.1 GNAT family N-acetyltransferase [Dactylosporangium vinaceum]